MAKKSRVLQSCFWSSSKPARSFSDCRRPEETSGCALRRPSGPRVGVSAVLVHFTSLFWGPSGAARQPRLVLVGHWPSLPTSREENTFLCNTVLRGLQIHCHRLQFLLPLLVHPHSPLAGRHVTGRRSVCPDLWGFRKHASWISCGRPSGSLPAHHGGGRWRHKDLVAHSLATPARARKAHAAAALPVAMGTKLDP